MADDERVRLARVYREQQSSLVGLFVDDLRALLGSVLGGRRPTQADAGDLTRIVAPVVGQYGSAGASLAGEFYEAQREAARLTQGFDLRVADPISEEVIGRSVGWAVRDRQTQARQDLAELRDRREAAIRDAEDRADTITVAPDTDEPSTDQDVVDLDNLDDVWQSDLEGALSRHVHTPARLTLEEAIDDDPESVAWVRITDGDPCGFCGLLASRGFCYLTRESALYIEGTRDPYHDNCGCTTMPRFRSDSSPLPDLNQELQDIWYAGPAYFSGEDARAAMQRAMRARKAGRDIRSAVFDGPATDPDRYQRKIAHDRATVEEYRKKAQRGGRNGKPPAGADNAADPRFR